ncbi:nicotinate-nucleotide adenylyltransferase [Acidiferrobacter thiooxydans]|uniref:nicotinate-nucleotide adenylyltransferase n=1 Tax=Acidiferrobacter thiooxydans TaxID=163359 RepID=UPI00159F287F|nr:nicotinate-nucleotide adenylyltransferase [Acidiferrobacter thiooxydans]UEN99413.1 nicotinate-nucleotide adenylyltransferase [Acidiferrobacter thiooxydans]
MTGISADNRALLGVFGGTFDPVHRGHVAVACALMRALPLSRIVFVPAARPPHRPTPFADAHHRLAMLRLALAGDPRFDIDEVEYEREGPSYMVDTLATLRARHGRPLALILGADAFAGLPAWHRWRRILGLAHIIIVSRPGFDDRLPEWVRPRLVRCGADLLDADHGRALRFTASARPESATALRQALADGIAPEAWLPPGVPAYIEAHGLYRRLSHHDEG